MRRIVIAAAMVVLVAPHVRAQRASAAGAGCPVVNGLVATATTGDSTSTSRDTTAARPLLRADARAVFDTTWRFDIAERRWTRPLFAASVGAGWAEGFGAADARGTTTAPDSGARRWSACAGASIGMQDPTLVLRRARGVVRLRVDLRPLARSSPTARDTTSQPRR